MTRSSPRPLKRLAVGLALGLTGLMALAACRGGETVSTSAPSIRAADGSVLPAAVSTQNAGDTRLARDVFSAARSASRQSSEPIGFYSRGCAAGNVAMPETGPTWQMMRLSRNRYWTQPIMAQFLTDLSRQAATIPGVEGLYIGDLSQPRGGPMNGGHASHQTGLDADIWMRLPDRLDLSSAERETISSTIMDRRDGAYTNDSWNPQIEAVIRMAASDPRVERIFVFPAAKVAMCDHATGDRSWLNRVRPWYGHNSHFHVRLACPPGATNCETQDPVPAGDGCEDARQWVRNILNPPPPDPNYVAPPSRGPATMASLPGQCTSVINSD